jgi:type IV pilus assembly protein PilC
MAAAAAPDLWEKHQLLEFRTRLIMGAGFREGLEAFPLVQPGSRALLLTGQECGRLDHYLLQVAGDLNGQASRRLSLWVRFLEPAMLLVLSLAIGGLILAYLLPMVAMLEQLA